jgi:hypothetical protein
MEGILALSIPIISILTFGAIFISRGPIGQAMARRLSGHSADDSSDEILELREQVELLRTEIGDVQERLDFAERLLARGRDPERIPEAR